MHHITFSFCAILLVQNMTAVAEIADRTEHKVLINDRVDNDPYFPMIVATHTRNGRVTKKRDIINK